MTTASPPSSRARITRRLCAGVAVAGVGLVLTQALLAGHLLAGNPDARQLHEQLGTEGFGTLLLVQFVAAVLVWRPGRGPWWPMPATIAIFAVVSVQIGMGFEGRVAVHVPLGVTVLLLELAIAALLLRRPRVAAEAAGDAAVSGAR